MLTRQIKKCDIHQIFGKMRYFIVVQPIFFVLNEGAKNGREDTDITIKIVFTVYFIKIVFN